LVLDLVANATVLLNRLAVLLSSLNRLAVLWCILDRLRLNIRLRRFKLRRTFR
jgi:hypothetical protein